MGRSKRKPPDGRGGLSGNFVVADCLDASRDNPTALKNQTYQLRRTPHGLADPITDIGWIGINEKSHLQVRLIDEPDGPMVDIRKCRGHIHGPRIQSAAALYIPADVLGPLIRLLDTARSIAGGAGQ